MEPLEGSPFLCGRPMFGNYGHFTEFLKQPQRDKANSSINFLLSMLLTVIVIIFSHAIQQYNDRKAPPLRMENARIAATL